MVTVDPDRDLAVLDGYVKSFIPTAIALGTTDESELAAPLNRLVRVILSRMWAPTSKLHTRRRCMLSMTKEPCCSRGRSAYLRLIFLLT